jgi:hypothetical protein
MPWSRACDDDNTDTHLHALQGPGAHNLQDTPNDTEDLHNQQVAHTDMPPGDDTEDLHNQQVAHTDMPPGDDTEDLHNQQVAHTDMPPGDDTEDLHNQQVAHTDMPPGDDTEDLHNEQVARDDTAVHTGVSTDQRLPAARVCIERSVHTDTHTAYSSLQNHGGGDNNAVEFRGVGTLELGWIERHLGVHRF